ncbi:MAG: hypothetical protein IIX01_00450 [Clostridia bacterium]|nr:hypothetical protein [Clostridia bacterium]
MRVRRQVCGFLAGVYKKYVGAGKTQKRQRSRASPLSRSRFQMRVRREACGFSKGAYIDVRDRRENVKATKKSGFPFPVVAFKCE